MGDVTNTTDARALESDVAAFSGLLDAEDRQPATTERPRRPDGRFAPTDTDGQQAEAAEDSEQPEEQARPEGDDPEAPQQDGETEESGETEAEADEQPQTKRFTVKVDGKEMQVDEGELIAGYQRQADYTRKTQEIAEARRQADEAQRQAANERQFYAQQLEAIQQRLKADEPQIDWDKLYQDDPIEYGRQRWKEQERREALQAAEAERARLADQDQQERSAALARHVAQARAQLLDEVPEWKDDAKRAAARASIAKFAAARGYTPEELAGLHDPRSIKILYEAMQYEQLRNRKTIEQKKVVESQKAPAKVQRPGAAAERGNKAEERRTANLQRVVKTGRIEDAAKAFETMI